MTAPGPRLSVIAVFHEMRREAARTLRTLTVPYQRGIDAADVEIIAVDNGSSAPLRRDDVDAVSADIRLPPAPAGNPSPSAAIPRAVAHARGEYVAVSIHGARTLSPGVLPP